MKNIPEKIFLQLGEDISEDFKEHHEVSWCVDKIYDTDLEYISIEQVRQLTAERDQFKKESIADNIKVEKMKLLMSKDQLDKLTQKKDSRCKKHGVILDYINGNLVCPICTYKINLKF